MASQVAQVVRHPLADAGATGDKGSISESKRPLEVEMATHSRILAWEIHGQRSLAGYSPWGCEESDMTEHKSSCKQHFFILHLLVLKLRALEA